MNDLIILATLLAGPKHGYQLKREAGFIFGDTALHNNLIYPLLRRFTAEGWVTKKAVAGQRGQTRQQYALTPLGHKTLVERLSTFSEDDSASFENFITRVGMFEILSPEVRKSILKRRENYLLQRQQQFATMQENIEMGGYAKEVVNNLCKQLKYELSWIQRLYRLSNEGKKERK
jgi:DNA-binding PadR family transcriptional regulator